MSKEKATRMNTGILFYHLLYNDTYKFFRSFRCGRLKRPKVDKLWEGDIDLDKEVAIKELKQPYERLIQFVTSNHESFKKLKQLHNEILDLEFHYVGYENEFLQDLRIMDYVSNLRMEDPDVMISHLQDVLHYIDGNLVLPYGDFIDDKVRYHGPYMEVEKED